jgi:hypothetical protein
MHSGLQRSNGWGGGGGARKRKTYVDANCSKVERWFSCLEDYVSCLSK